MVAGISFPHFWKKSSRFPLSYALRLWKRTRIYVEDLKLEAGFDRTTGLDGVDFLTEAF
jgi:hypothetical protein